jgi:hypothetical protein
MLEGWLVTIISIAGSTAITTFIATFINKSISKHFSKIEREESIRRSQSEKLLILESQRSKEEIKSDIRDTIREAIEPMKKDLEIIKKGTQAGLRYDLFMMADEWLAKGFCPRRIKADFEHLYTQYHLLGKNGVMDSTYQAILALPESLPEKKTTKKKAIKKTSSIQEKSLVNI